MRDSGKTTGSGNYTVLINDVKISRGTFLKGAELTCKPGKAVSGHQNPSRSAPLIANRDSHGNHQRTGTRCRPVNFRDIRLPMRGDAAIPIPVSEVLSDDLVSRHDCSSLSTACRACWPSAAQTTS